MSNEFKVRRIQEVQSTTLRLLLRWYEASLTLDSKLLDAFP